MKKYTLNNLPAELREVLNSQSITNVSMHSDPISAVKGIERIYYESCSNITKSFLDAAKHPKKDISHPPEGNYPYICFYVPADSLHRDATLSFGIVDAPGVYGSTVTRPDLFNEYYLEQLTLLHNHHKMKFYVGLSAIPIPLPFVIDTVSEKIDPKHRHKLSLDFALPNLNLINDDIANCINHTGPGEPFPISLFSGKRVDYSLHRLHHYTNTSPKHFQNFILLTNYQRYIESFKDYAHKILESSDEYTEFVEPGDFITQNKHHKSEFNQGKLPEHLPQMPAYHLKRKDGNGITFINIGVGPSNAKNITDHLAVIRPHCFIMLGHCAGLRSTQKLGDYVLAHAYQREDDVMESDLPSWVPIPPIAEVQVAIQQAVAQVTGEDTKNLKSRMRTGTLVSVSNRNWELQTQSLLPRFKQSRAMALDMESATIAANGFRFRVPYGTLLCVSDKPIHGEIKLRGMANSFYEQRVSQHLQIGIETIRIIRENGSDQLHSRKLRGFEEPPFR